MTSIAERLSGGDVRSIGDAEGVARDLIHDQALVAEAAGLKKLLLRLMATARQQEVRWHIAQMLPLIELTPRERHAARKTSRGFLNDSTRIVQVCARQALWDLATSEGAERESFRSLVERLAAGGSPAVKARGETPARSRASAANKELKLPKTGRLRSFAGQVQCPVDSAAISGIEDRPDQRSSEAR